MNRIATCCIAAALAGIAITASAAGMQEDGMRRRASGMLIRRVERQLNLTDSQRASIRIILKQEQPAIQDIAARARQQNTQLLSSASFNEAQVRAFAKEHEATAEDALVEREKVRHELLDVLTPEQQKKLRQMRAEHSADLTDFLANLGDRI